MIQTQNKSNRLFKNKITLGFIVLFIIGLIVFIGIKIHKSPMSRKLMGFWNIEYENTYWTRDSIYDLNGCIMYISKDTIDLPQVYEPCNIDFQGKTFLELDDEFFTDEIIAKYKRYSDEMTQNAKGTWKIISNNPDSVFFNVPKNPLHGKYAIRFFIDRNGWRNMRNNILKIELKNDSTYLICNKGSVMYKREIRDWEGKN